MKIKVIFTILACFLLCLSLQLKAGNKKNGQRLAENNVWQYVDPRIGSVGVGRTFPGPCMPFGMAKPGPDCGVLPNAGWAPLPEKVTGFSQTHVSGTGGGQKYGNILLLPYLNKPTAQRRVSEDIALGSYSTMFENGIRTEITASERCAFYRIHYPQGNGGRHVANAGLQIDATHFLGKDSVPDLRERQQFVGGEVEIVNSCELRGFSRVRGGWNNGDAYTVYFHLLSDKPLFKDVAQTVDNPNANLCFGVNDTLLNIKMGISYVSTQQAKRNIPACNFDAQLILLRDSWERYLSRIAIQGTEQQKRMFYTALYHTMLMPVDKTGENPKWTDAPYYDDYYAIWDTYRTSTPLITLLDEQREVDIVNSLLNIYKREGYMCDARSGDCNGRTQGGSNADIVVADAFVKGVGKDKIDYELALEAMLKDGETDPGADHEKHGRGGLNEYLKLGYVPYGIDRAGTRTIEYAYDDYCIAQVARGLGRTDVYEQYMRRSENWKNLWRGDYEWQGMRGFILPKDADGQWLDSVPWGRSKVFRPLISYTPITKVAPWYLPWWSTFFYEALSAEYSLSIPHDVPALIEACGGSDAFRKRLDTFFDEGHYNVQNEPSFLTPCLYHWIGRPDLSVERVHQIVREHYSDQPNGLPGNDDSGAMSSWLAFHMMGFYPNAGQSYYLLLAPMVPEYTLQLCNGRVLHVVKKGKGNRVKRIVLNGEEMKDARVEHSQLMEGGEMVFEMMKVKQVERTRSGQSVEVVNDEWKPLQSFANCQFHFTLNRQFRTWPVAIGWEGDTLMLSCKQTLYRIPRKVVEQSDRFCWLIPADHAIYNNVEGTFGFVSYRAMRQMELNGSFVYDAITWRKIGMNNGIYHVRADIDGTEMWIKWIGTEQGGRQGVPLVVKMQKNPLGIDWEVSVR